MPADNTPDMVLVSRDDLRAIMEWGGDELAFNERQMVVARVAAAVSGPAATVEYSHRVLDKNDEQVGVTHAWVPSVRAWDREQPKGAPHRMERQQLMRGPWLPVPEVDHDAT